MNKEFIPYTQALALKELRFDEECFYFLKHKDKLPKLMLDTIGYFNKQNIDIYCSAPLYQQAFRWFRKEYKLESSIQRMPPEVYGKGKGYIKNYMLYIWAENLNPRGQFTLHFDTYEEAELECLKKLIEIIKNK